MNNSLDHSRDVVEKRFFYAQDVADYMGIAVPTAYRIMQQLNEELKEMGYITISGRINKKYFLKRIYSYCDD